MNKFSIVQNHCNLFRTANHIVDDYCTKHIVSLSSLFLFAGLSHADYSNYQAYRKGTRKTFSIKKIESLLTYIMQASDNK